MLLLRRFGLDAFLVGFATVVALSVLSSSAEHRVTVAAISAASLLVFCARQPAALAVVVGSFGMQAAGMRLEPSSTMMQFVAMLLTFALAEVVVTRRRELAAVVVCGLGLLAYGTFIVPGGNGTGDFVLTAAISLGFLVAAREVFRRGQLVSEVRDSAEAAVAAQQVRARQALVEERARIARELHDVVSHGLSVVIVQAQAARSAMDDLADDDGGQVGRRLEAVESTAREALVEMRRMLGLLQLDEVDGVPGAESVGNPEPPSPGMADLTVLIDRARSAGCEVTADLDPAPCGDPGVQLAVYRIVQESLTNVIKHAPGAQVELRVVVGSAQLEVWVCNSVPVAGPRVPAEGGHGLVGMRERAVTYGGRCTAGYLDPNRFEVHAVLPLEPGSTGQPAERLAAQRTNQMVLP